MTINIFVLKGELNGKNRSGAFLFLLGICSVALPQGAVGWAAVCDYVIS